MATQNNNNGDVFTLDELAVRRGGTGGHYNATTRRLTLARTVLASVGDSREVYVVFGRRRSVIVSDTVIANSIARRIHSVQCFIAIPTAVAKAWGDSGTVEVEYRLSPAPKPAKK